MKKKKEKAPVVFFNEDGTMRLKNYSYTGVETIKGQEGERLSALIDKEGFRYVPNHGDFRTFGTVNLNKNQRLPISENENAYPPNFEDCITLKKREIHEPKLRSELIARTGQPYLWCQDSQSQYW